ncbi:unnamed protein product [Effrenium voratum]|uniref:Uncharacterized protein n=1 Tax=Effrenium voratum TaxID=2562239 RepID=A0AA36HJI8_9DINO|nr:unnamed protein product [Effrenium voratum]CAJ1443116.1 unnamed protein product [Effrenium voratum]
MAFLSRNARVAARAWRWSSTQSQTTASGPTGAGATFQKMADALNDAEGGLKQKMRTAKAGRVQAADAIQYEKETLMKELIRKHIQDMPMKMSPVSVYYILKKDIQNIFRLVREAEEAKLKAEMGHRKQRTEPPAESEAGAQSSNKAATQAPGLEPAETGTGSAEPPETGHAESEPQILDEEGYESFNAWRRETKRTPRDEAFELFMQLYKAEREGHFAQRRWDITRRKRSRRVFGLLNRGYKEVEEEHEAQEEEFSDDWRKKSILEDLWKAEYYRHHHRRLREDIPERESPGRLALRTDQVADVVASALRSEYADQNRPVLTHELADYENPYMMKRSAMERLLQERCVRNQLDERVMPRLLDKDPDLVKLRREAALPPEVLEPLAAFRGDVRWNFDARERLAQKVDAASAALDMISKEEAPKPDVAAVTQGLPENLVDDAASKLPGLHHPWRNHVGFDTAVPRGMAGGTKFGQPEPALQAQVTRLRYPTLQRVAHTLPADPKWRAHVVRSIRVLERSKDWDFKSKLEAMNRMKEVYDSLKPSEVYTAGLDEKLVVNRVASHIKRKYARDAEYVKTYRKRWLKEKSFYRYRPSLTATAPLKKEKKK